MLNCVEIRHRLDFLVGVLVFSVMIAVGGSLYGTKRIGHDVKSMAAYGIPLLEVIDEIDTIKMTQITVVERVLRYNGQVNKTAESRKNLEEAMHTFIMLGKQEDALLLKAKEVLSNLSASLPSSASHAATEGIQVLLDKVDKEFDDYGTYVSQLFELIQKGSATEIDQALKGLPKEETEVNQAIDQCVKAVRKHIELSALDATHIEEELRTYLVPVVLFALACVFFILIPIDISLKSIDKGAKRQLRSETAL